METALIDAALALAVVATQTSTARLTSCHDADTCRAQTEQGTIKVCLADINVPEIDQSHRREAQTGICGLICGRVVDIEPRGTSYDRLVSLIRV